MFLHHQPYCIMSWTVITVALLSRPERCYFRSAYIQSANNACFIELPSLQGYNVYISNCHYNVKSPLPVPILVTPQSHCRFHHGRISGEWEVVHVFKLRVVCLQGRWRARGLAVLLHHIHLQTAELRGRVGRIPAICSEWSRVQITPWRSISSLRLLSKVCRSAVGCSLPPIEWVPGDIPRETEWSGAWTCPFTPI